MKRLTDNRPYAHKRSFTLIELITVIVVVGLISVATFPLFSTTLSDRARLVASRDLLRSDLRFVQNLALSAENGDFYGLDVSSDHYILLKNGAPAVATKWPGAVGNRRNLAGVTLTATDFLFNSLSEPSIPMVFSLSNGAGTLTLTLAANGAIQ